MMRRVFAATAMLFAATVAVAATSPVAGSLEATLRGKAIALAALQSAYEITLDGDVATVLVRQTFENPYDEPLNARYLFPLNKGAAVHAMTMHVGNEVISAQIQEIQQAKQTFAAASKAGKAATLLEQHRPNMFTQRVANLMPGLPIEVTIEYAQLVPKVDGAFELVVPLVVGPRFQPAGAGLAPAGAAPEDAPAGAGTWQLETLPAYPPAAGVHLPRHIVKDRISLHAELEAPVPVQAVSSATHPLEIRHVSSTQRTIRFADGKALDNRDFVLRYELGAATTSVGLLSHWQAGEGGYFSLLIEPPVDVPDLEALPREMVFLLDCSGSMSGLPMEASKKFMREALHNLRPLDAFRIIRFSDTATEFSHAPLPATPANIARGLAYTDQLYGSGGTMMTEGIRQALAAPPLPGTVRNVVFLTDGYIGNEHSVLALVDALRGDARLVAFGVGSGVNRYLLSELGRVGHGFTRYFDPTRGDEDVQAAASALAARLQTPVLTDLEVDWGTLPVTDVSPRKLPDLYAGDTLRITGRFTRPASGEVSIRGSGRNLRASVTHAVALSDADSRPAVRRVWARTAIADLMHAFIAPPALRPDSMNNAQLQAAVTDLGLRHGLTTRWTAFVAVSRKVYNASPAAARDADVAVPQVAGTTKLAYAPTAMTGFGAPEPGLLLGAMIAMLTLAFLGRRPRRVARRWRAA